MTEYYTPKQVAQRFGISTAALRCRRIRGQIEGTIIDENTILYTEEQIKAANLSQRKRGPKKKEASNRTEKGKSAPVSDESTSDTPMQGDAA